MQANVNIEIKKEFNLIKRRCLAEMRKRCEAAVKADVDEVRMLIKTGRLETEGELVSKLDELRMAMHQKLEAITYSEKEPYVA